MGKRFSLEGLVWEFCSGFRARVFFFLWDGARWFDLSFGSCILCFHNKAHESRCTLPELSLFPALLSRIGVVLFVRLCRNSWLRVPIAFQLPGFEFQQ